MFLFTPFLSQFPKSSFKDNHEILMLSEFPFSNCICSLNHISCSWLTFVCCASSNVSSNSLHQKMHSDIGCICSTFHHCVFSNVSSICLPQRMQSHIGCICLSFLHCGFLNDSSIIEAQCTWIRACLVALVAFVWLFSTVRFQMCS